MGMAQGILDVAHMQVSLAGTVEFVRAYQQDGPLTTAELWAFPTMLRLACLETLVHSFSHPSKLIRFCSVTLLTILG